MSYRISVIPAYGRDYKSKKAIISDLLAGKDFILNEFGAPWDGKPINLEQMEGKDIRVRYGQLRKVCVVKQSEVDKEHQLDFI